MKMVITIELDEKDLEMLKEIEKEETKKDESTNCNPHARVYDSNCPAWCKDPEVNMMFLQQQQIYVNELLKRRGHVFLNEIYDMLGFKRSKAGAMVGWIYDEEHPYGDNFIDFGLNNVKDYSGDIILDFNVDGIILNLI
jgi:hypothetical protein